MKKIEVGDTVRYTARFLRSTGMYTGNVPFARGEVISLRPLGRGSDTVLAEVQWDREGPAERVNVFNLEVVRPKGSKQDSFIPFD